jgi:hypothetical protein
MRVVPLVLNDLARFEVHISGEFLEMVQEL